MIAEFGLALAVMASPALGADGQDAPPPSDANRRFQESRLTQAGFPPIQPPVAEFRRLMLSDPYMMLGVPGIELRRNEAGEVDLILQYPAWRSDPVPVDADLWRTITEQDLFAVPEASAQTSATRAGPPPEPPPICHGWSGVIQDEAGRLSSWHGCSGPAGSASDFSVRLVTAALSTRPECAQDASSPFFAFQRCFGLKPELDDPALEAAFAPLRREWDALPGAQNLAAARTALQTPNMRQGDTAWLNARRAVEAIKRIQDQRRGLTQRVSELQYAAAAASQADRYKLSRTLENWAGFTGSQDRNYIPLLEALLDVER